MKPEQRVVLFRSEPAGSFLNKRKDNLDEINALLEIGWRVVMISPTSSPSMPNPGNPAAPAEQGVFALVLLERQRHGVGLGGSLS